MSPQFISSRTFRSTSTPVLGLLLLGLLNIWPALTNGQPFFYPDSTAYVRGADLAISKALGSKLATEWARDPRRRISSDTPGAAALPDATGNSPQSSRRVVLAGRSITYGSLLYLGELMGQMWFPIIVQSLLASYITFVFIVRALGLAFRYFVISSLFLSVASPLPFFTSLLMPDVFAGFLILGFALMFVCWDRLSPVERGMLSVVLLFSVLAHTSHLFLLLSLTAIMSGYARCLGRAQWLNIRWPTLIAGACLVAAIIWEAMIALAVSRGFGAPPVRPPFFTAKVVSMLGKPAVVKVCLSKTFVVCRFVDRLPVDSDSFLWSEDERTGIFTVADAPTKRLLDHEQPRFALAIVPPNLRRLLGLFMLDSLRQLTSIGLSEYSYGPLDFFKARLPADYFHHMALSVAARSDDYVIFGRTVLFVSAILAYLTTILFLVAVGRDRSISNSADGERVRKWRAMTHILLLGIILNAIICGSLSTVHDRYQARVTWLIQLSMIAGIFAVKQDWRGFTKDHSGLEIELPGKNIL